MTGNLKQKYRVNIEEPTITHTYFLERVECSRDCALIFCKMKLNFFIYGEYHLELLDLYTVYLVVLFREYKFRFVRQALFRTESEFLNF
jgi:hypothetical protein